MPFSVWSAYYMEKDIQASQRSGCSNINTGLKFGRSFGALMFPMLQRCLFEKPATIYFLLRKTSSIGELWETEYALFALLRLSQFCTFYGSTWLRWMCGAWDPKAYKNVVVELSV
jgi:hypothetical protein